LGLFDGLCVTFGMAGAQLWIIRQVQRHTSRAVGASKEIGGFTVLSAFGAGTVRVGADQIRQAIGISTAVGAQTQPAIAGCADPNDLI